MKAQENSFLSNSIITLTRQVASIVIGALILYLSMKGLGKTKLGIYSVITYLPLFLMTFLNFGFNSSTVFFISRKKVDLNAAFSTNIILGIGLSVISMGVGALAIEIFSQTLFKDTDASLLYISLLGLPGMFLMIFLQTILQGIQHFRSFNTALVVNQFSNLFFLILFLFVFHLGVLGAILSFMLGYYFAVIYMMFFLVKNAQARFSLRMFSTEHFKAMFVYGLKAHVSNVMTFLNYRLDVYILKFFLISNGSIGLYTAAVGIGEKLSIFSQSFSQVLLPRIASSNLEEDRNKITSMLSRFILILVIIVSVLIILFSDYVFELLHLYSFMKSSLLLKLLLPGLTLLTVEKILSNDLAGRGKPELNMYVSFFNVAFNVIFNIILIPRIGVKAAAIDSSLTYIASFIIKAFIFRSVTKLKFRDFLIIKRSDFVLMKKLYRNLRYRTAVNK
jgi:O-antigen/teichoic acid export membrane protein